MDNEQIFQPEGEAAQTVEEVQSVEDKSPVQSVGDEETTYEPPPIDTGAVSPPPPAGRFPFRLIILSIIGITVLAGTIFGIYYFLNNGIVQKGKSSSGEVTLTYWGLWEPEDVVQPVIEEFEKKYPNITITYTYTSITQYRERLQAAIQRGEGPDVFRFHNTWAPMLANDLAGIPPSVLSTDQAKKIYYPSVVDDMTYQGRLIGIPYSIDMLMLFYNKKMFNDKNVRVPTTWDEFEEVAHLLTEKDDAGVVTTAGAAIGAADNVEHFSDILGLIFYQNGVLFPELTSKAAEQALQFYTLFALPPNNVWDITQDNSIVAFASGNVAMIFAPSWQAHTIHAINPDLEFGTSTVPKLSGATPVAWGTYWAEGVSAQSAHKDEAFTFLQYLTEKETAEKLFANAAKLESRLFGEPYARMDMRKTLEKNTYLKPIAKDAPIMRSWYFASRTKDNGINDKNINYLKDAVNAVLNGSSPRGALETASKGINQVLSEYNVK